MARTSFRQPEVPLSRLYCESCIICTAQDTDDEDAPEAQGFPDAKPAHGYTAPRRHVRVRFVAGFMHRQAGVPSEESRAKGLEM